MSRARYDYADWDDGRVCFDDWYRLFMTPAMCEVAYDKSAKGVADIIFGAVVVADGKIATANLRAQFMARGMAGGDFDAILAGLEQAGRVHERGGRLYLGFPTPRGANG